ncbi:DNA-binding transcriptional regulator, MocR family, contains an aminotransferase domain [Caloramator quimbayensis]|uniref:DNA-binding transcriptional regulator, MocR family, contains an aminotransferase domain n=1 Tax=Caloramator quimbayensis TaxID=1147123 RepID=A0A1T4WSE0_9CLOT|nr:PLP-dependent aminotransferase family protein [Caloramator quimbayensis]SKA79531.1 DNA-binding transcriptional regulator, MocR family, contains an aminotransferase domain [Caloramator quimbayensis]
MKIYESIEINKNSDEPLYMQVYDGIRNLIENGSFKPDEKLPPIREFSKRLEVNNVTIVSAYKLLEQKGYVYSKVGSGTFVRGIKAFEENKIEDEGEINSSNKVNEIVKINLSSMNPEPELFPVDDFKEALNEVLERDRGLAFAYSESQGYYPLRESIREYLKGNNIPCDFNNIHVISGAQQGIDIISKSLLGFNDTIVVESPTYTGAVAAFKSRGASIIEVPIDEDGINIKELETVLKSCNPKLIYIMSNYHNPTGISYSNAKKLQLLYLAQKYNTYILEDDYLSELKFYGDKSTSIKTMDGKDRVIYLKSFSKIFMPGIRLAFLITPSVITKKVSSVKYNTDISTSSLIQRAFDLFLRRGQWQNHLDKMWKIYKNRYDVLADTLKKEAPFIQFKEPKGGIHVFAKSDVSSTILASVAKQRGLLISPGKVFYIDGRDTEYFRLSFASADEGKIKEGIEILKEAYDDVKNSF